MLAGADAVGDEYGVAQPAAELLALRLEDGPQVVALALAEMSGVLLVAVALEQFDDGHVAAESREALLVEERRHPADGARGRAVGRPVVEPFEVVVGAVAGLVEREVDDDAGAVSRGLQHGVGDLGGVSDVGVGDVDLALGPAPEVPERDGWLVTEAVLELGVDEGAQCAA